MYIRVSIYEGLNQPPLREVFLELRPESIVPTVEQLRYAAMFVSLALQAEQEYPRHAARV